MENAAFRHMSGCFVLEEKDADIAFEYESLRCSGLSLSRSPLNAKNSDDACLESPANVRDLIRDMLRGLIPGFPQRFTVEQTEDDEDYPEDNLIERPWNGQKPESA